MGDYAGLTLTGRDRFDNLGRSVVDVGDMNGDGIADFAVSAPNDSYFVDNFSQSGAVYVVFGADDGSLPAGLTAAEIDGDNGFRVFQPDGGGSSFGLGHLIAGGDVDGDGLGDLVVATYSQYDFFRFGRATDIFVLFGRDTDGGDEAFEAEVDVSDLEGAGAVSITGVNGTPRFLSADADVNGDGLADIVIGQQPFGYYGEFVAFDAPPPGPSLDVNDPFLGYVVFGDETLGAADDPAAGDDRVFSVGDLNGRNGFGVVGEAGDGGGFYGEFGGYYGSGLIPIGDVNGDGFTDLLGRNLVSSYQPVGDAFYYGGVNDEGVYDPTRYGPYYDYQFVRESQAFIIFGHAVADAEGGTDFPAAIDAPAFFEDAGADGEAVSLNWTVLTESTEGYYNGDSFAVAGVGDVNGDGFDDVAFSFPYLSGRSSGDEEQEYGRSGVVYVLFGGPDGLDDGAPGDEDGLPQTFFGFFQNEGEDGFAIFDGQTDIFQNFGAHIAAAGDINGDGVGDFLITIARADANPDDDVDDPGAVLLVFGRDTDGGDDPFPTFFDVNALSQDDVDANIYRFEGFQDRQQLGGGLYGNAQPISAAGDVNGDGFDDLIVGAPYTDAPTDRDFSTGQAYVIFGGPEALEAADAADGANDNAINVANLPVDVGTGLLPIQVSLRNAGFSVSSVAEGDPGEAGAPRELVFIAQRTGDLTAAVSVDFAVAPRAGTSAAFNADAADFAGGAFPSGTVSFASGAATAEIRVAVNPDEAVENNEQLQVTLANPSTDAPDGVTLAPGAQTAFGSITNDDFPVRFSVFASSASEGDAPADAGVLRFTVSRSGETQVAATVDFTLDGGPFSDAAEAGTADVAEVRVDGVAVAAGLAASGSLAFAAGDTSKVIEVVATTDLIIEDSERVRLTLSNADADGAPAEILNATRDAFILNDDLPVTLSVTGRNAEEDSGDDLVFEIRRSGDQDSPVTVTYTVGGSGSGAASDDDIAGISDENGAQAGGAATRTVTFQPGETVKTVRVSLTPDALEETSERVRLSIDAAESAEAQGVQGVGRTGDAFIVNDDFPPQVTLSATPDDFGGTFTPSVTEGDPNNRDGTVRPPNTVSLFFNRRGEEDGAVTVFFDLRQQTDFGAFRSADGLDLFEVRGADGAFDPIQSLPFTGSVTIPDGQTSAEVVIAINSDLAPEPNEFFEAVITGVQADDFTQYEVLNRDLNVQIRNDDGLPPNFRDGVPFDDDGDPSTPPVIINVEADIFGDPHIVTLDGLGYSFQAVGDYILVESIDQTAANAFQVQARFEPLPGSDLVSVTTRMAVEIAGTLVEFDAKSANPLLLDGVAAAHDFATGPLDLDSDGLGDVFFDDATGMYILVLLRDGDGTPIRGLEVKAESGFGGFLNVCTFLAPSDIGAVRGLQGDADGDLTDDFQLRSGEALPEGAVDLSSGVPSPTFEFLYGAYRDSWRLTGAAGEDNASLFTAGADPFDPTFPAAAIDIDDLPPELLAAGQAAAAGIQDPILRANAILDFALTGDAAFVAGAAGVAADPTEETDPSGAPEVANFVTIAADAAAVVEGDAGERAVTFTVFREAADDEALGAAFSLTASLDGDMDAGDGVALASSTVMFEAGQTEATVTVTFDGDTMNEDDETIIVTIASDDPSVVVAGSMAMTSVQTDDTPPVLADDAFAVVATEALTGDLTAPNPAQADVDAQGDAITVTRIIDSDGVSRTVTGGTVTLPSGARLTVAADGGFTFNPFGFFTGIGVDGVTDWDALGGGEIGLETFQYVAEDGNGGESMATVEISITGVDDAPVTVIDEIEVAEDALKGTGNVITGTISPDFDPEGGPLRVVRLIGDGVTETLDPSTGAHVMTSGGGAVTMLADGSFTFAVDGDGDGTGDFESLGDRPGQLPSRLVSVQYVVADEAGNESTETLRVSVRGDNDGPTAVADSASTDFQTAVAIDVLDNDVDPEDDDLTVTEVIATDETFGTVEINDDGTLTYTPEDGFAGVARFGYIVSDGEQSEIGEVAVTVDGPGARTFTVDSLSIVEGDDGATSGVLTVRRTGDLRVTDTLSGTTRSGTATEFVDFVGADLIGAFGPGVGLVTLPVAVFGDTDIEGFEQFFVDFSISSAFDNFTVDAAAAPDGSAFAFTAPVGIIDDDFAIAVDSPSALESDGSVTFTITRQGDLPAANFGVELVEGTATSPEDFLGDGLFLPIQFAQGQVETTFTVGLVDDRPAEDDETFTLRLFGDDGVVAQGTATILNDDAPNTGAPVAADDSFVVPLNRTNIRLDALANDSDPDGDAFRILVGTQPANGRVAVGGNNPVFFYTPDEAGQTSFTYNLTDGELASAVATVSIDVIDTGTNPFFVTNVEVVEGDAGETTRATFDIFRNGGLSEESEGFFFEIVDGSATSPDDYAGNVLFLPFSFAPGEFQTQLSITVNGDDAFEGDESFFLNLRSTDSGNVLATGRATILNDDERPNAPPVAADDMAEVGEDDGETALPNLLANDTDDAEGLRVAAAFDSAGAAIALGVATALPEGGVITIGEDGDVLFDPAGDFEALGFNPQPEPPAAVARVAYRIEDAGGLTADATLEIGVRGANDAPVAADVTVTGGEDDGPLTLTLFDEDSDVDDGVDGLQVEIVRDPDFGALTDLGGGVFEYAGEEVELQNLRDGEVPFDSFRFVLVDAQGARSEEARGFIRIVGENDGPTAVDDGPFAAIEGESTGPLNVLANDEDPEGDPLTIVGGDAATALGGVVVVAADGRSLSVDYSGVDLPDLAEGETRADSFEYIVSEGELEDAATVSLTLTGKADDAVLNEVLGTDGNDVLRGTDVADLIRSLGGRSDVVSGGAAQDVFDFSDSTANGSRDRRTILDFEAGETIDLGGVGIATSRAVGERLFLFLEGDRDVITVNGVSSLDDINIA